MSFVSLRFRHKYVIVLFFCFGIYCLCHWYIVGKSSINMKDSEDISIITNALPMHIPMHSTLTHDVVNYASYADAPTVRFLKALDDAGALNNTFLVLFSDHGIRYGALRYIFIGKFEERMPFMYIHVPKWFLKQHPKVGKNLFVNQGRLITLFDVHATLKHLLHLNQYLLEDTDELGMSLFNEVSEKRTCEKANIQTHWCPCVHFETVPLHDLVVVTVAYSLVRYINELLAPHANICEMLDIHAITDALMVLSNDLGWNFAGIGDVITNSRNKQTDSYYGFVDYLVTIKTQPGGVIFEGTVQYDDKNNVTKVLDVSRINMYGTQSWCIDSPNLQLYCYCKTQLI